MARSSTSLFTMAKAGKEAQINADNVTCWGRARLTTLCRPLETNILQNFLARVGMDEVDFQALCDI